MKIKPCPFCGAVPEESKGTAYPYWVEHKEGCYWTGGQVLWNPLIKRWNRRIPQPNKRKTT